MSSIHTKLPSWELGDYFSRRWVSLVNIDVTHFRCVIISADGYSPSNICRWIIKSGLHLTMSVM